MLKEDYSEKNLEILFLSEESRKLIQALSNTNSLKILKLLEDKDMSAGELAENLSLGLSTLKYNLDSLLDAGMIRVSEIKWSQRGRKIKIYEPVEKIIVLVPGCRNSCKEEILGMFLKNTQENFCIDGD
ncbi:ArsR/SmtB family transcription factor [Methanosarcina sp. T3]|uniref:ArsR/SmtB family transcription factor n=1 Tax=Methanosarcina sp. T3 TaxID=3439062 RepID=UPI003F879756